jgi:carbamoyl-phosphate synthase large subunit
VSDDVRLGLIVGGIAAVLLALAWRFLVLNRRRRRVRRSLRAADPQDRARAGVVLVDDGLQRSARTLLKLVAHEPDGRVRHAIALAVARRQWEPVNSTRVRQLREWASGELALHGQAVQAFGPAVTRLSDMGGPRPTDMGGPQPATVGAPPAPEPAAPPAEPAAPSAPPGPPESDHAAPAVHWNADTAEQR